jgi:hypothetical protein
MIKGVLNKGRSCAGRLAGKLAGREIGGEEQPPASRVEAVSARAVSMNYRLPLMRETRQNFEYLLSPLSASKSCKLFLLLYDVPLFAIMTVGVFTEWRKLPMSLSELCINTTLRCGQSFR